MATPNQTINNENRSRIIESCLNGNSPSEIANILGFKRTKIYSIIKKYKNGLPIERQLKGGSRNKKLTEESKVLIKNWIDDDCGVTIMEIKQRLFEQKSISVSQSTIARCIDSFNYTLKRVHNISERRNSEDVINERATYAERFMNILSSINGNKIFFIDEVGFSLSMRVRRGRSLAGKRVTQTVTNIRLRNISVCCAMNKNGILKYEAQTRAFNTESFLDFIRLVLAQLAVNEVVRAILILDNVRFHKTAVVHNEIVRAGHSLIFLPPYSPFLNPIENMFSEWKQFIRRCSSRTEDELLENIQNGELNITSTNCNNYFAHVLRYMIPCSRREPVIEE
ncbi:uncharacterized protein LOC105845029 [Hydra vulgaris]|uniref:uncharacterized protein LOC105845029 n=1 Tax=Hydra vulgaris TaxID=6087 RepID=UPI0006410459|nr:uncharacterized protein LOC105845029 [Hydra vulgaris]